MMPLSHPTSIRYTSAVSRRHGMPPVALFGGWRRDAWARDTILFWQAAQHFLIWQVAQRLMERVIGPRGLLKDKV